MCFFPLNLFTFPFIFLLFLFVSRLNINKILLSVKIVQMKASEKIWNDNTGRRYVCRRNAFSGSMLNIKKVVAFHFHCFMLFSFTYIFLFSLWLLSFLGVNYHHHIKYLHINKLHILLHPFFVHLDLASFPTIQHIFARLLTVICGREHQIAQCSNKYVLIKRNVNFSWDSFQRSWRSMQICMPGRKNSTLSLLILSDF